jgi:hypothetical protein
MTDDKICWIDNVDYKYMKASEAAAQEANASQRSPEASSLPPSSSSSPAVSPQDPSLLSPQAQLLSDFNIDEGKLLSLIEKGITVYGTVSDGNLWNDMKRDVKNLVTGKDRKLRIELPRILTLIDPVFSLHQLNDKDKAVRPSENYLSGSNIRLKFDYEPKQNETLPLYIYSDFANFKVTIKFEEGKSVVKNVELI